MRIAIEEAICGKKENGIPIGAVLERGGLIIGKGHNKRVQENDPILHAEIDCLRNAGRIRDYKDTTLYSTLMPCYLCAGAIIQFGIKRVVVGDSVSFHGAKELLLEHGVELIDLNRRECKELMSEFIANNPKLWNEDIGK